MSQSVLFHATRVRAAKVVLLSVLATIGMPVHGQAAPADTRPTLSSEVPLPPRVRSVEVLPVLVDVRPEAPAIASPHFSGPPFVAAPPNAARLPAPARDPLAINPAMDPILADARATASPEAFRSLIQDAIERHPMLDESAAFANEARYALYQQRAALAPSAEINIVGFQVLDRDFGDDSVDLIVERTRASRRFDEYASVNQLVTDFGATNSRVQAASARLQAAALGVDNSAEQAALNTVAAWYDVYSYRTILAITEAYRQDQLRSRDAIAHRIANYASAEVDAALVENAIAQLDIRTARFQQQLASAEARFRELTGTPPPPGLMRAPELGRIPATLEAAREAAESTPASRAARFQAQAAERDATAAQRDLLPTVTASVDAGRYGLLESQRNYDVVARVNLRQRLFGGLPQRAKASDARAEAMKARARRVAEENARDAATAFSDLEALHRQVEALEVAYIATLQTRDATMQRFAASRGTLFDVINASDTFYSAAVGYVQALAQRDAARYVVLARTGELLEALEIPTYRTRDH